MTAQRPAREPWGLIVLLGALTAFAPMSIDLYLPGLPSIARDLRSTDAAAELTVSVFFLGMAAGQFVYGPTSDRYGRRGPLLLGIGVYIVASLVCWTAPTMPVLIGGRLVQALGCCAGVVVARAVVRDRFDHHDSARVLSLLSLVMGLAPILAPLAGSAILKLAGWRPVFAVLTAFGVAVGLAALLRLPESRSEATALRARAEHPVRAYLALLGQRRLLGYLIAGSANGACLFTYISSAPAMLMGNYGLQPGRFSVFFAANAVGIIGGSQLNRYLLRRRTPDQVLVIFGQVALAGAVLLALAAFTGIGGMWTVLPPLFVVLGSYGVMTGNTAAGALSVDPLRSGSTSALMGAGSFGVGALGSTIAAAIPLTEPKPLAIVCLACLVISVLAIRLMALRLPIAQSGR